MCDVPLHTHQNFLACCALTIGFHFSQLSKSSGNKQPPKMGSISQASYE